MRLLALSAFSLMMVGAAHGEVLDSASIWVDLRHSVGRCIVTTDPGQKTEETASCSCALIAPDAIITAQHCIHPDFRTRPANAPKQRIHIKFQLGDDGETSISQHTAVQIIARGQGDQAQRPDWITLRLRETVTAGKPLPLSVGPAIGQQLAIVGYGKTDQTQPYTPTIQTNCHIVRLTATQIVHDCPLRPGDSGAPLLSYDGAGWRVIAINHKLDAHIKSSAIDISYIATPASREMLTGLSPQ